MPWNSITQFVSRRKSAVATCKYCDASVLANTYLLVLYNAQLLQLYAVTMTARCFIDPLNFSI